MQRSSAMIFLMAASTAGKTSNPLNDYDIDGDHAKDAKGSNVLQKNDGEGDALLVSGCSCGVPGESLAGLLLLQGFTIIVENYNIT